MTGRTYRYFKGDPLFPFGYGLSYTTFNYGNIKLEQTIKVGENCQNGYSCNGIPGIVTGKKQ